MILMKALTTMILWKTIKPDDFDGIDEDFGEPSNHAYPNPDDCPHGFDLDEFTLGMGLGQELAYGERRRRRKDDDC